ncbi:phosphoglucosamine mutase [Mucilaginibacter sp. ZT4R22]|uniref:Phosphoglucosamine mutase n=1 Tax=Mucilaginibacter pankratovii TaxID=2772110 RepID=A0ABR7WTA9_9SPHI|nr:phosphoglucosamine mutase [Mucilaginibacter pankratovii]MBD1364502.1 phosphoglucosamine mutase [Mucilaginibacter pankratovii]
MTLIKSISGIRGTIGGTPGDGLTPADVVKFTAAYGRWVIETTGKRKVVIGRDARISGRMVNHLVTGTLMGLGIDVVDLGLSTTPTVEIAVPDEQAGGGIIITASHNPKQWNALKLLNFKGEFINDNEGKKVLELAEDTSWAFAEVDELGKVTYDDTYLQKHIDKILALPLVDVAAIKAANFSVVIDCVNSTGGLFLPPLLKALGVNQVDELYCEPTGQFPHNPEPLPENLTAIAGRVVEIGADLGIVVDPDVDRLCFVNQDGSMFGEEYTLVAVADHILRNTPGNTVSNLSSTRALRDVTENLGGVYEASAVGEVNVVTKMKAVNAVIGGEGNGGIIYPELHYGRDALVGIALFLTMLAKSGKSILELRKTYPAYYISKNKITLTDDMDIDALLKEVESKYSHQPYSTIDGLKIEFGKQWVHLRRSNTEPVIRIYSEANSMENADKLAHQIIEDITGLLAV